MNAAERPPLRDEHPVTVGYDATVRTASWSCPCGASGLQRHARPGMGERTARRLVGILAERHQRGEDES